MTKPSVLRENPVCAEPVEKLQDCLAMDHGSLQLRVTLKGSLKGILKGLLKGLLKGFLKGIYKGSIRFRVLGLGFRVLL